VFAHYPIEVVSAEGVWLNTRDGRRVLDMYGGHAVAALGYGHIQWLQALEKQAGEVVFQTNAVPMEVRERAATRLVKFSGLDLDTVFFVNSGAEANESALRLAFRIAAGRTQVVAVEQGFHGRTAAAGAVTYGAAKTWYGFPRAPFDVSFLPRPTHDTLTPASSPASGKGEEAWAAAVRETITEKTAAVIVEPVQGLAGAYDLGKAYLQALRQRCDETGTLLIFDEVQCGVGRCGESFAAKLYGVTPDMLTAAKALGSGFPVAALLMSSKVAQHLKVGDLGTTFGGGPMACAIVEAVVDAIERQNLLANVRTVSELIRSTCLVGPVTGTQGAGFLLGLKTSRPARDIHKELLQRDILAGTSSDPNILRLLPPYTLAAEHVDRLRAALQEIGA
jgi:acetylornithine/succinyldiaminopimelate/putrescine aminotransferase